MTRALYLIGPPGVGKTSVVDGLLDRYERMLPGPLRGLLRGEALQSLGSGEIVGVHLGYRRHTFGGTDVLGMAVQPDAIRWVEEGLLPLRLIGEGQRLGNAPFLTVLAKHADLTVIHLSAASAILDARCAARGSQQSESWRKGAATRALRTADRLEAAGVHVVDVAADRPLPEVVARVRDESGW